MKVECLKLRLNMTKRDYISPYDEGHSQILLVTGNLRTACAIFGALLFLTMHVPAVQAVTGSTEKSGLSQNMGARFSTKECYRTNIPLALKVAEKLIPPEVKFYCAAPWNVKAFESVRSALERQGFDVVESFVRTVPVYKQSTLRSATFFAKKAADEGPPNMGVIWYVQRTLPLLHALKFKTSDEAVVIKGFLPRDVNALRAAALAINWQQLALEPVPFANITAKNISQKMTLVEVPRIILEIQTK